MQVKLAMNASCKSTESKRYMFHQLHFSPAIGRAIAEMKDCLTYSYENG